MQEEIESNQVNAVNSDETNSVQMDNGENRRLRIPKSWLFAMLIALIALSGYVISESCELDGTEQCYP